MSQSASWWYDVCFFRFCQTLINSLFHFGQDFVQDCNSCDNFQKDSSSKLMAAISSNRSTRLNSESCDIVSRAFELVNHGAIFEYAKKRFHFEEMSRLCSAQFRPKRVSSTGQCILGKLSYKLWLVYAMHLLQSIQQSSLVSSQWIPASMVNATQSTWSVCQTRNISPLTPVHGLWLVFVHHWLCCAAWSRSVIVRHWSRRRKHVHLKYTCFSTACWRFQFHKQVILSHDFPEGEPDANLVSEGKNLV